MDIQESSAESTRVVFAAGSWMKWGMGDHGAADAEGLREAVQASMPLPDYRVLGAAILVDGATIRGYGEGQRISIFDLPDVVAEVIKEEVEMSQGVGAIEALAAQAEVQDGFLRLSLPGGAEVVRMNWLQNWGTFPAY